MTISFDRREFLVASSAAVGLTAAATSPLYTKGARVRVVGLKVDYLDQPLGLDNSRPRLSWRLESDARNVRQSAYRIFVASNESTLKEGRGDLWDSGKVASRMSFGIRYLGRELTSRSRCFWYVEVWDDQGSAAVSASSWWEMGLLRSADWAAQWIAAEDTITEADREAGLHWIWSEPSRGGPHAGFA
jgi:alpha-L-rhamnosidase